MRVEPLKRLATQKLEGSGQEGNGQEVDGMLVGILEPDYGFLTGASILGGLDPRDETFEQRGFPVEQLDEVQVDLEDPAKRVKIGKLLTP